MDASTSPEPDLALLMSLTLSATALGLQRRRKRRRRMEAALDPDHASEGAGPPRRRVGGTQGKDTRVPFHREGDPHATKWFALLTRLQLEPIAADRERFRRKAGVSYAVFKEVVRLCKAQAGYTAAQEQREQRPTGPVPFGLKVLASLVVLRRDVPFDVVACCAGCSGAVIISFFNKVFLAALGGTVRPHAEGVETSEFYRTWVPGVPDETALRAAEQTYAHLPELGFGLPGCVGTVGVIHVPWRPCPPEWRSGFGERQGYPTVAYSVVTDHARRFLHVQPAHRGCENDKWIFRTDTFLARFRHEPLFLEYEYRMGHGQTQGAYCFRPATPPGIPSLMSAMRTPVAPLERALASAEQVIAEDVPDAFAQLKARFAIVKQGLLVGDKARVDQIVFAAVALHNRLLVAEADGSRGTMGDADSDFEDLASNGGAELESSLRRWRQRSHEDLSGLGTQHSAYDEGLPDDPAYHELQERIHAHIGTALPHLAALGQIEARRM